MSGRIPPHAIAGRTVICVAGNVLYPLDWVKKLTTKIMSLPGRVW